MFYIFNVEKKCIGTSDNAVNLKDLASRKEFAIESNETIEIEFAEAVDGKLVRKMPQPTADEIKQQKLAAIESEYQPKFEQLQRAVGAATLLGNPIDKIQAQYKALFTAYCAAKKDVNTNG